MARTAKKVAKKKAVKGATLPKGFTPISRSSQSWPDDNTKSGNMIQGTIIEFDVIQVKRNKKMVDVQLAKVETANGVFTVWESAGLAPIFEYEDGVEVAIIYKGMGKAKKGQNAPRLYEIGIKE